MQAASKTQTLKEGDWTCPSCGNHNFASRKVCNRCGGPKPPPPGANAKEGDWICPACENHNYASRQACNRCGHPKPGTFAAGMGGMMGMAMGGWQGGKGGGWQGGGFQGGGFQGGKGCMGGKGGMGQAAAAGPGGMRPGDWICGSCGNHNYASRDNCNKCGAPKSQQNTGFGGAMMKGGGPRSAPYGMAMQPPGMRPGDWICPSCGNHNYASRDNCNKCQHPKSAPVSFRQGDWMCPNCGNHNYASRTNCNKCGTAKP